MSRKNFNFFLFYLGFPFMIEGFKLSGEIGLGICIFSYIAVDAVQTFDIDLLSPVNRFVSLLQKAYVKSTGLEFEMPVILRPDLTLQPENQLLAA